MEIKPSFIDAPGIDLYVPEHDFAYLCVPKCGGSTMRSALGVEMVSRDVAMQATHRLAVIRHPLGRIISAWHSGWQDVPFDAWWEHVRKAPAWDIHTQPEVELVQGATEIRRLEDISSWWREYRALPKQMPHENRSRYDWDALCDGLFHRCVEDILAVYADDVRLWHGA